MNKIRVAAAIAQFGGLTWLSRHFAPWRGVVVLNYHRIGSPGGSPFDHGLWSATPDDFDWQVAWLKKNYDLITPHEFTMAAKAGQNRCVAITFDDGYRDNYDTAYQILRAHNVKATFFITTGLIDRTSTPWWDLIAWMVRTTNRCQVNIARWSPVPITIDRLDREPAISRLLRIYKSLPSVEAKEFLSDLHLHLDIPATPVGLLREPWMTWDMIRDMYASGMCIGGHTHTHPVLSQLPLDGQRIEIQTCSQRLQDELKARIDLFSYPVGGPAAFNDITRELLRQEGYRYAFSYYGGLSDLDPRDPFDIPRFAVEMDTTRSMFSLLTSAPALFKAINYY